MGNKNSQTLKWKPLGRDQALQLLKQNIYDPSNKDNDYMEQLELPKSASLKQGSDIIREVSPSLKIACKTDMVQSCINFEKL